MVDKEEAAGKAASFFVSWNLYLLWQGFRYRMGNIIKNNKKRKEGELWEK